VQRIAAFGTSLLPTKELSKHCSAANIKTSFFNGLKPVEIGCIISPQDLRQIY
jgi:hypothetical protein